MRMPQRNWSDYNQARKTELSRFIAAAKEVLDELGPPAPEPAPPGQRGPGRPPYRSYSLFLVNLLRIYLKVGYRDIQALLEANPDLCRSLGLESVPGRNTINLYAKRIPAAYLKQYNHVLTQRLKKTRSTLPSMPPVSRSSGTRDVGKLPRSATE